MKAMFGFLLGFGLGLAVVLGQRMDADAMTVAAGVFVGMVASVPMVLVLLHRTNQRRTAQVLASCASQKPVERTVGHPPDILGRRRARRACCDAHRPLADAETLDGRGGPSGRTVQRQKRGMAVADIPVPAGWLWYNRQPKGFC